jgi:vitamin-K-epoxide reductase (warfarin-sensitive)
LIPLGLLLRFLMRIVKGDMRLLRLLIVLLAIGGVVDSVLALRIHMQDPNAAPPCAVTENFDCGAVNHSRYAVFPARGFDEDPNSKGHIPVAAIGIAGYLLIGVLALFKMDFLTFEAAQIGLFCALLLTFLEKYVLEKWCIYCIWSQGIVAAIFVLSAINLWLNRRKAREGLHLRAI